MPPCLTLPSVLLCSYPCSGGAVEQQSRHAARPAVQPHLLLPSPAIPARLFPCGGVGREGQAGGRVEIERRLQGDCPGVWAGGDT